MEKKVEAMKSEKNKKDEDGNKKNTEEPGFWGSWKGYLTIGVIVVAVLGAVVYFIKTNSSEEGEGE